MRHIHGFCIAFKFHFPCLKFLLGLSPTCNFHWAREALEPRESPMNKAKMERELTVRQPVGCVKALGKQSASQISIHRRKGSQHLLHQ